MSVTNITLYGSDPSRYKLDADYEMIGRRYDNNADQIKVFFPPLEDSDEHSCEMIISRGNRNIDLIQIPSSGTLVAIKNNISQYDWVEISFRFIGSDNYLKQSEKKRFYFEDAHLPAQFTPEDPQYETTLAELIVEIANLNGAIRSLNNRVTKLQDQMQTLNTAQLLDVGGSSSIST